MIDNNYDLAQEVFNILETIRLGDVDPLDFKLVNAYRKLQELFLETEEKLQIDEMLNEVLGSKVLRIQELARILTSPELYVKKLKTFKTRQLAKLAEYRHPIIIKHCSYDSLSKSYQKIASLIDSLQRPTPEERIPDSSSLPSDYAFHSEDPFLLDNLEKFISTLPKKKSVPIDQVLDCMEFDEFLRRFLYVILVISRGMVDYNPQTMKMRRF